MEMLVKRLVSWVMWTQHGGAHKKPDFSRNLNNFLKFCSFFMHKTFQMKSASLKIDISLHIVTALLVLTNRGQNSAHK